MRDFRLLVPRRRLGGCLWLLFGSGGGCPVRSLAILPPRPGSKVLPKYLGLTGAAVLQAIRVLEQLLAELLVEEGVGLASVELERPHAVPRQEGDAPLRLAAGELEPTADGVVHVRLVDLQVPLRGAVLAVCIYVVEVGVRGGGHQAPGRLAPGALILEELDPAAGLVPASGGLLTRAPFRLIRGHLWRCCALFGTHRMDAWALRQETRG
mmetsp:Transcript_17007/g.44144  ORF Transcript_17007/g.44144 Transcript_17007/m.44144 type:complete len:210 (-) Transcript_17007:203-832(-)